MIKGYVRIEGGGLKELDPLIVKAELELSGLDFAVHETMIVNDVGTVRIVQIFNASFILVAKGDYDL